jgi:16S rRNA (uracil1498-N3)-methyltransferase
VTDGRPPAHRVYFSDLAGLGADSLLSVPGEEANHAARVKRLRPGEPVELFDARGTVAPAEVVRAESGKRAVLEVRVGALRSVLPMTPHIEVWCPPPKGDRLETMIDQLSQVGVSAWRPLRCERSERDAFRPEKLERAAIESAKQCGRAWSIQIGDWAGFEYAVRDPRVVLADASGGACQGVGGSAVLLLGPEGGWTPAEMELAREAGCRVCRFGPHVMRIETAAVAGAARLMAGESAGGLR